MKTVPPHKRQEARQIYEAHLRRCNGCLSDGTWVCTYGQLLKFRYEGRDLYGRPIDTDGKLLDA